MILMSYILWILFLMFVWLMLPRGGYTRYANLGGVDEVMIFTFV